MQLLPILLLFGAALAEPTPGSTSSPSTGDSGADLNDTWCHQPGNRCSKLKRAVDAAAAAVAEPVPKFDHLEARSDPVVAKRAAAALAEAIANANAVANPEDLNSFGRWCHHAGQGCSRKVRRTAEAISEALAQPDLDPADHPHPDAQDLTRRCNSLGEDCSKAKRAADELLNAANEAVASLHDA